MRPEQMEPVEGFSAEQAKDYIRAVDDYVRELAEKLRIYSGISDKWPDSLKRKLGEVIGEINTENPLRAASDLEQFVSEIEKSSIKGKEIN